MPFTPIVYSELWETYLKPFAGKASTLGLEIGCYEGTSTCWFIDNILTGRDSGMIVIDPFCMGDAKRVFLEKISSSSKYTSKITIEVGYSQDVVRKFDAETFNFIYIDGSHRIDSVLTDAINSFYVLRENGILIFDDYHLMDKYSNPKPAIDSFLTCFSDRIELLHKGNQVILRKLI